MTTAQKIQHIRRQLAFYATLLVIDSNSAIRKQDYTTAYMAELAKIMNEDTNT